MKLPLIRRDSHGGAAAGVWLLGAMVSAGAETAPAPGPAIPLETMVVVATPDYRPLEEGWQVGEVPGFRIFSHGNAAHAGVAEQLQRTRAAFGLVWNDEAVARRFVTVVVTADEPEFLAWAKLPADALDRTTRVIDTPSGAVLLVNGGHEAAQRAAGRGWVLALLRGTKLPRWLQEGLAQIVNSTETTGDRLQVGRVQRDPRNQVPVESLHQLNSMMTLDARASAGPGSPMAGSPSSQFEDARYFTNSRGQQMEVTLDGRTANRFELQQHANEELRRRAEERHTYSPTGDFQSYLTDSVVLPLNRVLDPEAPDSVAWRMNAWAFTHYCLFGDKQRNRPVFMKFVQQLEQPSARQPLEVFEQSFGLSAAKMELNLALYARHGGYDIPDFKLAEPFQPVKPAMAAAPEANVLLLHARVLGATGRGAEARQLLVRGHANPANRTPPYVRQLIELERDHDPARAAELLEDAARREQLDNPGRRLLVGLRLERLQRGGARLSPDDLRMVLLPLFTALEKGDQSEELFVLIGRAWAASAVPPKPEHLNALRLGLTYHPDSRQLAELLRQLEQS